MVHFNYKSYQNILLDLDGTVVDSGEGITKSVRFALASLGIEVERLQDLYPFIGPPLTESFRQFYHLEEKEIEKAIGKYRERYEVKGIYENVLYEGMENVLAEWKRKGKNICLCTSKPEKFARKILEDLRLTSYFTFIGGATLDGERNTKTEVMQYVLASCPGLKKSETVMVGDRKYDMIGAKEAGVGAIGVLYGYGSREELLQTGALALAETATDLKKILP